MTNFRIKKLLFDQYDEEKIYFNFIVSQLLLDVLN